MQNRSLKNWIDKIRQGDLRAVARACSLIENEDPISEKILSLLYRFSGNSIVVGITGPPGSGKSVLLSCLVDEAIHHQYKVGVIAVDPSSPLSGGAILADRLRIRSATDERVYIRSLATRRTPGSFSPASFGILRVLEAMGKGMIFVETVGSGQNEVEVTRLATTTLLVTVPNLGDEIQALKSGISELSDIFVVNKSDLGNSETTVSQLRSVLTMKDLSETSPYSFPSSSRTRRENRTEQTTPQPHRSMNQWKSPILAVSALQKRGIAKIFSSILEHQNYLVSSGELEVRNKERISAEIFSILERKIKTKIESNLTDKRLQNLAIKKEDLYSFVRKTLSKRK